MCKFKIDEITYSKCQSRKYMTLLTQAWERGGDFFQGGCNFYIKN